MSSRSFNQLWLDATTELEKQLEIERRYSQTADDDGGAAAAAAAARPKAVSIEEAFGHFSRLYVSYVQILTKLERCYDAIVQPQKRVDIKETMEFVICRVVHLRHQLVRWNPPNPDVRVPQGGGDQPPFPWEYVDLLGALREMGVPPSAVETPAPRYFREDNSRQQRQRDAMVEGYMQLKLGKDAVALDDVSVVEEGEGEGEGGEDSIRVLEEEISANECSSSGETSSGGGDDEQLSSSSDDDMDSDDAATRLQSWTRGSFVRAKVRRDMREECVFIGMRGSGAFGKNPAEEAEADAYTRRKQEQLENQEAYEQALHDLKDAVLEEEGFEMRESLREVRIGWVTDQIAQTSVIPDSLDGFYKPPEPVNDGEGDADAKKGGGGKSKGKEKEAGKKGKDGKSKKGKGKDKAGADGTETLSLQGPAKILDKLAKTADTFKERWQPSLSNSDMSEKHDPELAKNLIIRGQVQKELTKVVDDTLMANLKKVKELHADSKKGKGKKGGKSKGKGKKGKKGKKGGGKKEKPLPGEKMSAMKKMDSAHMLSVLIEHKLVNNPEKKQIQDLSGSSHSAHESPLLCSDGAAPESAWIPKDPTMQQLRSAVSEYCVLPNGSSDVKKRLEDEHNVRSIMLYGPGGTGKTLIAEAVASSLGALFINLSPVRLRGRFGDKSGATQLVHMAFTVAKDPTYAPVVIYLDECEEFFQPTSKKKKGPTVDKNGPVRFQKDLLLYKNQGLKKEDRVIIIGCSRNPDKADMKVLKWKGPSGKPEKQGFFERFLYFPALQYPDRVSLWQRMLSQKMLELDQPPTIPHLDYGSLAHCSEGHTPGNIKKSITDVLTADRVQSLPSTPLSEKEFLDKLPLSSKVTDEELKMFLDFTKKATDLDARKKAIEGPAGKENGKKSSNKKKAK